MEADRSYWLEQLSGELPMLELPGDHVRPAVKTYRGGIVSRRLDGMVSQGLKRLSQEQGGTLFMGLLSVVKILLHRYTGQDDILIGTQVAGRGQAELEGQIGCYLNTLVLRTRLKGDESYREVLSEVKRVTLEGYEHQGYPFDVLVEELSLERDRSRHPLFDVSVVLQNAVDERMFSDWKLEGLEVKSYGGIEDGMSKFDWAFDLTEAGEEIELWIVYNSDIYEGRMME